MSDNVRTFTVGEDDDGIRLDRWFKRHLPDVSFNIVSRWARTGQLRLDGKRVAPGDRIEVGQTLRVPPAEAAPMEGAKPKRIVQPLTEDEEAFVQDMVIARGRDWFVLNKPPGLATQGGTKTNQHLDRLLDGLVNDDGQRPKLVHRLDKDTSGALLVARSARGGGPFRQGVQQPHRKEGLLGDHRRRTVAGGRNDRRAAGETARNRRRENACR